MKIELSIGEAGSLGLPFDPNSTGETVIVEIGAVELAARISLSGKGVMTVEEASEYLTTRRLVAASVSGALDRPDRNSLCLDTGGFLEFGSNCSVTIEEEDLYHWFRVFFKAFWKQQSEEARQEYLEKTSVEISTWVRNTLLSVFLSFANSDSGFELEFPCVGSIMSDCYTDFLMSREESDSLEVEADLTRARDELRLPQLQMEVTNR